MRSPLSSTRFEIGCVHIRHCPFTSVADDSDIATQSLTFAYDEAELFESFLSSLHLLLKQLQLTKYHKKLGYRKQTARHALCRLKSCQLLCTVPKSHLKRRAVGEWPRTTLKVIGRAAIRYAISLAISNNDSVLHRFHSPLAFHCNCFHLVPIAD